jgi:hypothetical protein
MSPFITGLRLSQEFFVSAVQPLLQARFPNVPYSAALIGPGSEVLGFDTDQSTDHDWGPRLNLFLPQCDLEARGPTIDDTLRHGIPQEILGFSTNFVRNSDGTAALHPAPKGGPVNHGVSLHTIDGYFQQYVGIDPSRELSATDWLSIPEQVLRSVTAGRVFYDGLRRLEAMRDKLRYYPRDVWLYLLATQWHRISQEEAFVGRCGQTGDELGSRLVAARLVRDLMRLCFLMERRYAPYIKWLGTAFQQLDCAPKLMPILMQTLQATDWQARQTSLSTAYEFVAERHNALGVTASLPTSVSQFYDRPFFVIHGDVFADAIRAQIASDEVRSLPAHVGGIDQFVDSADILSDPELATRSAVFLGRQS